MDKIKFAVIGLGNIGQRHATMISENPDAELVAIADINTSLEKGAKEDFKVDFFSSIDEMLKSDREIDVITICTPNGLHAAQSIQVLNGGYHVVCEKPLGLSKNSCEEVIHQALVAAKHVFCVMQNRYSPPSVWLKKIIDDGVLGKVFMVQMNLYWNRGDAYYDESEWKGTLELDGGPLYTQFSHFIDIMYWLFGDINNIHAKFENYNHKHNTEFEDSGLINFDFLDDGVGSIAYSTALFNKNFESSIAIIAQNGTLKVGGQYMDKVEYCDIKDYEMPVLSPPNPPNDYGAYKGSAANHQYIFRNVIDTLKGASTVTTNALEGLKVVEIIGRVYEQRKS